MDYFDLHCDTATKLFDADETLDRTECHVRRDCFRTFSSYGQVFAVFSKPGLSDDGCYERFFDVADSFEKKNGIEFRLWREDVAPSENNYILSVEDGRLISGDISRVGKLFDRGVRILTPLWAGITCIGGSFDTDEGLTKHGADVIRECVSLGIITDISHSSERSADEILDICEAPGAPVIASHSDSYSVYPHPRNISDARAKSVASSGGIVGVCLHAPHLAESGADCESVFKHIDRLVSLIGERSVAVGADFDGTDFLPRGIASQKDVYKIADVMLKHNYGEDAVKAIMYGNAFYFFKNNLPKRRIQK